MIQRARSRLGMKIRFGRWISALCRRSWQIGVARPIRAAIDEHLGAACGKPSRSSSLCGDRARETELIVSSVVVLHDAEAYERLRYRASKSDASQRISSVKSGRLGAVTD